MGGWGDLVSGVRTAAEWAWSMEGQAKDLSGWLWTSRGSTEVCELRDGRWKATSTKPHWEGRKLKLRRTAVLPGPGASMRCSHQLQGPAQCLPGSPYPCPSLPTFEDRSWHGTQKQHGVLQN